MLLELILKLKVLISSSTIKYALEVVRGTVASFVSIVINGTGVVVGV